MNRRGFLKFLPVVVGGIALEQAIPFNRVWSFPSKIVAPKVGTYKLDFSRQAFALPDYPLFNTIDWDLPHVVGSRVPFRYPRSYPISFEVVKVSRVAGLDIEAVPA